MGHIPSVILALCGVVFVVLSAGTLHVFLLIATVAFVAAAANSLHEVRSN